MPKIISGAPSPDTSPANIARVLRLVTQAPDWQSLAKFGGEALNLADALDATPVPMTWEERVKAASVPYRTGRDAYSQPVRKLVASILRAAFPELAPADD